MHWIDWLIMLLPIIICGSIAVYSRRFVRGVADFMAGGRNAGRFLICTARSEMGAGATGMVARFQGFRAAGFGLGWWGSIQVPISLLTMITGYVIYRYRQTRSLTLGQFFETRYSRRFRLFTGVLGFLAGIFNFGIIPAVGSRCMVNLLSLPLSFHVTAFTVSTHLPLSFHPAAFTVPTYLLLMGIFLSVSVLTTTTGGQVSVLLTDCAEGMVSQIFYTAIALILIFFFFNWTLTKHTLLDTPATKSLVNPFDAFGISDFNIWMVLMGMVTGGFYRTIAWQNCHAFNASAVSPHEQRMGGILGSWRGYAGGTMMTLLAVCALTYLHDAQHAASVEKLLAGLPDNATRDQMRMPTALSQFLPRGIKGMLLSICLMGTISDAGMHLHSWGSICIQDVILPFRRHPLTPKQHLVLLRLSVAGVALWAFFFGALFPQMKYVQFWWAITEAIFVGGAGIAIVGGLYWKRGTTAGAWTGLLVGSSLAFTGVLADLYCRRWLPKGQDWIVHGHRLSHGDAFILNGVYVSFISGVMACLSYGLVSLLTCRHPHNMDRLLNRGQYAPQGAAPQATQAPAQPRQRANWLYRLVGINDEFTRYDRWLTLSVFWWSMFWFVFFIAGTTTYLLHRYRHHWPNRDYNPLWADYWLCNGIYLPLVIGVITTIWFTIGCWHDIWVFFGRLNTEVVNDHDDGTVAHAEDREGADLIPAAEPGAALTTRQE